MTLNHCSESASAVVLQGMEQQPNAYVYAIAVDGVVRYIGKGSGIPLKRAKQHLRDARRINRQRANGLRKFVVYADHQLAKALGRGASIEISVVSDRMTHEQAFAKEVQIIASAPSGQLWNMSGGGDGAGQVSNETRRRLSKLASERMADPARRDNLARQWDSFTAEHRRNFIEASRAVHGRPGNRERLVKNAKVNWDDPHKKAAMLDALDRGRRAPRSSERNQKRWANPEWRAAHSARMKELWADPAFRDKQTGLVRKWAATPERRAAQLKATRTRWDREKGLA